MKTLVQQLTLLTTLLCALAECCTIAQTSDAAAERSRLETLSLRMHELRTGHNAPDDEGYVCLMIQRVGGAEIIVDAALLEGAEGQPPQRHVRFFSVPFDLMMYGRNSSAKNARRLFLLRLEEKIEDIHRAHPLSEEQKSKLKSAGRVDIAKFFLRVERLRPGFDEVHVLEKDDWEMIRPVEAMQRDLQGNPFGEGSYFQRAFQRNVAEPAGHE